MTLALRDIVQLYRYFHSICAALYCIFEKRRMSNLEGSYITTLLTSARILDKCREAKIHVGCSVVVIGALEKEL